MEKKKKLKEKVKLNSIKISTRNQLSNSKHPLTKKLCDID